MDLIFVYNADSGKLNVLFDVGHKIVSPGTYKCDLCTLTHGTFTERIVIRQRVNSVGGDFEATLAFYDV